MAETKRTLNEIEVALAKYPRFDFRKNIVAFNVIESSPILPIGHICDMLICDESGYLTEIKIERSWQDFLTNFKKKHDGIIAFFYYCVPSFLYKKVRDYLFENEVMCAGIITYTEDLIISEKSIRIKSVGGNKGYIEIMRIACNGYKKLFLEQQLEIARLGAINVIGLKESLIKYDNMIRKS